jgi:hypothetical protein
MVLANCQLQTWHCGIAFTRKTRVVGGEHELLSLSVGETPTDKLSISHLFLHLYLPVLHLFSSQFQHNIEE